MVDGKNGLLLISYVVTTTVSMTCYPAAGCDGLRNHAGLVDFHTAMQVATTPNSTHAWLLGYLYDDLIKRPCDTNWFIAAQVGNGSKWIKLISECDGIIQAEHGAV